MNLSPWSRCLLTALLAVATGCTDGTSHTGASSDLSGNAGSGTAVAPSPALAYEKDFSIEYYRLRLEYLDQGDWTTLAIGDPAKVVKVRKLDQSGTANVLTVDRAQIGLNTNFGKDLSVTVDYALTTDALDAPLAFSLSKGVAGTVTLRFSMVIGDTAELVREFVAQSEPIDFTLDLSPWKKHPPIKAPLARAQKKGIALYYPWYSLDSWKSEQLLDKPMTPYASDNPEDLKRQMDQAKSAGLSGFVVSFTGAGTSSDKNIKLLLDVAAQNSFEIGFFLETTIEGLTNHPEAIAASLSYLADTYSNHPALLEIEGRAVVVPWLTCDTALEHWTSARQTLRAQGKDVWLIQDCHDMEYLSVFDGVWYDGAIGGLGEKVRYYSVLADDPAPKLWIPTAMPGFDEHLLPDRVNPRVYPRNNGDALTKALSVAVASSPHFIALYTWNEWWENTHIEPSVNYGDQYLRITGEYVRPWLE